jgi:Transposase, Mutator family
MASNCLTSCDRINANLCGPCDVAVTKFTREFRRTTEAWRAVLNLVDRGLRRSAFLIVDGASGLEKAIAAVWDGVPVQSCTVHKLHQPELDWTAGTWLSDQVWCPWPLGREHFLLRHCTQEGLHWNLAEAPTSLM